jgi:hypothetical protein
MGWRPWLALAGIVIPIATLLSLGAKRVASSSAVPLWMYIENWTTAYLESPGARQDLMSFGGTILSSFLLLAVWAWAGGFILGLVARRAIPVNGTLFCLIALSTGLLQVLVPGRYHYSNAVVYSAGFYSVILPLTVQCFFVVLPSVWGMYLGLRATKVPKMLRRVLWASAVTTIVSLALRHWVWVLCALTGQRACMEWVVWAGFARIAGVPQGPQIPTLPLALVGPIGYVVAMVVWRRWRGRTAPA